MIKQNVMSLLADYCYTIDGIMKDNLKVSPYNSYYVAKCKMSKCVTPKSLLNQVNETFV